MAELRHYRHARCCGAAAERAEGLRSAFGQRGLCLGANNREKILAEWTSDTTASPSRRSNGGRCALQVTTPALQIEGASARISAHSTRWKTSNSPFRAASSFVSQVRLAAAKQRCSGSSRGSKSRMRGTISQGGRDVSALPPTHAATTASSFQSYALFPNLSIFDNVAYGLVNRGKRRAEVKGASPNCWSW